MQQRLQDAAPEMYEVLKEIEKASRTSGTASGHIGFLARRVLAKIETKPDIWPEAAYYAPTVFTQTEGRL